MLRKLFLALVVCTFVIVVAVGVAVRQTYRFWLAQPEENAEQIAYTVESGDTLSAMVPELADAGLVHPFWFKVYAKLSGRADEIRPGSYTLEEGSSYSEILGRLSYGNETEVSVTLPEGYTVAQMGKIITSKFNITEAEWAFYTGMDTPLEAHPFIVAAQKPENVDLEGYLFPDTYRFFADASVEQIVTELLDTMQERVQMLNFTLPMNDEVVTLHDALTLASIVEKEVRQPTTMANVADIFLKRLEIGMALQSDATVNYITGGDDPSVSYADLQIDSQYNTYKYPGLPPGPISNPGVNALAAVATPASNPYFYFLTTNSGEIYYAETHEQHVANRVHLD